MLRWMILLVLCFASASPVLAQATEDDAKAALLASGNSKSAADAAAAQYTTDSNAVVAKYNAYYLYYVNTWQPANGGPDMDLDAYFTQAFNDITQAGVSNSQAQTQITGGNGLQSQAAVELGTLMYTACVTDATNAAAAFDGATQEYDVEATGYLSDADEQLNLANQILQIN